MYKAKIKFVILVGGLYRVGIRWSEIKRGDEAVGAEEYGASIEASAAERSTATRIAPSDYSHTTRKSPRKNEAIHGAGISGSALLRLAMVWSRAAC